MNLLQLFGYDPINICNAVLYQNHTELGLAYLLFSGVGNIS